MVAGLVPKGPQVTPETRQLVSAIGAPTVDFRSNPVNVQGVASQSDLSSTIIVSSYGDLNFLLLTACSIKDLTLQSS